MLIECSIILWPALPLLLLPSASARKLFLAISAWGQANWLGLAVMCLRFICGTRIYIHTKGCLTYFKNKTKSKTKSIYESAPSSETS